jgi:hypothetical protein
MERQIWGGSFPELRSHIERLRARMSDARIPRELVEAFTNITGECWRSHQRSIEEAPGLDPGISTQLLDAREDVHEAVRAYLRRDRDRKKLAIEAMASVQAALSDDFD